MKRVLFTLTILGSLLLGSCEKEQLTAPADENLIKADKGILCRGCGQWDFTDPGIDSGATANRSIMTTDTVATSTKTNKSKKEKN